MSSAEHEGGDSLKIAHLEEAQAVSLTGSFTWWKDSSRVELSAQARRILDLPQAEEVTLPNILARVHPEDVEAFQQTVVEAARAAHVRTPHHMGKSCSSSWSWVFNSCWRVRLSSFLAGLLDLLVEATCI